MKQKLLNNFKLRALMLVAILCAGFTSAWGDEVVTYTLTPASGTNSSYAGNCDITISGITWNLSGNSQQQPWRIGGKSLSGVDRTLYSKTAIADNVSKIEVTHGAASSITVNSWTVIVASDANFTNVVSTLTPTFAANSTTTITRPEGKDWSSCYYKFVYNVTVSGTSNKFLEFSKAEFYKESGSSDPIQLDAPELAATANNGSVTLEWNAINNASSYTIQYADNASFTGATTVTDATSPKEISGLTNGTTYYFKAMTVGDGTNYLSSDYGDAVSATPANVSKITITQDNLTDFTNAYKWYDWTAGGVSGSAYAYKNGGMQFNSSKEGYWIYNTTAIPGNITSVKMVKASGTDRSWTLKAGTSVISTTDGGTQIGSAQTVGTSGATWDVEGSYKYFCLIVSGGATVISSIEITYIPSTDPAISASDVDITYDATSGSIDYTLDNATGNVSATVTTGSDWLTLGTITSSFVPFTCSANTGAERTATVTLSFSGADDKVVTVTQAAAPVIYTTIPALFEAATTAGSTATNVNVTFGNWVVSGVSGSNAFVTDNSGNGFIIYTSSHGFAVNDKLSGTVNGTPLKLYNGFAEFTNLTASTTGLTVSNDGAITVITDKTIADLSGVNTGAVITLNNLTYDGTNLSDGTNTIKPYNTLYSSMSFESGHKYNVTGVYQQFGNSTKEILPRSSADIVEVQDPSVVPTSTSVNVTAAAANGTINVSYNNFTLDAADIVWYESDGTTSSTYAWLTASINADNNIEYNIQANVSTEERKAYFKVYALDSEANEVYSELITVTQAGYVPDYATLPFSFDGGRADIDNTNGLTHSGLDTDYSSSPYLKFKDQGSYVILQIQGGTPAILTFDIKGNSFSGGTFTVQTSTDGSNYNNPPLAEFTELGATQTVGYNIDVTVTHIKWIYTTKASGNVALGNIKLASSEISVSDAGFTTYTTQSDVSFPYGVTAYKATQVNTNTIHLESVDNVPAGTPLVIQAAEGTYTLNYSSSATSITDNILLSSDGSVKGDGSTKWALAKFEDEIGFNVVGNNVTIPAGKAYLNIPSTPGVKAFLSFDFSDADGIQEIEKNQELMANGQIFNLAGQRLSKMQKGINIVNGKKILVK